MFSPATCYKHSYTTYCYRFVTIRLTRTKRKEPDMTPTHRRVAVLLSAGVILAAIAGWTVWAASSSSTNHAGYTADAADQSATASSVSTTHRTASSTSSSADSSTAQSSRSGASATDDQAADPEYNADQHSAAPQMASGYAAHNDPYLPPHAVVGQAAPAEPTKVYRPTNIVPAPAKPAASTEANNQVQSTPEGSSTAPKDSKQHGTSTPGSTSNEPMSPAPTPSPEQPQRPQGGRPVPTEPEDPVPAAEQVSDAPVSQKASDNSPGQSAPAEPAPSAQSGFNPREVIDRVTQGIRP